MGAPRCSDCNKFVSLELGEPELQSVEVNGDSILVDARLVLNCAECGQEIREANVSEEQTIEHDCPKYDPKSEDDIEFEFISEDIGGMEERYLEEDAKGKKIPARFRKKFYYADAVISLKCPLCKEEWDETIRLEEQASMFEDIY